MNILTVRIQPGQGVGPWWRINFPAMGRDVA